MARLEGGPEEQGHFEQRKLEPRGAGGGVTAMLDAPLRIDHWQPQLL